jgi:hypothetical protein
MILSTARGSSWILLCLKPTPDPLSRCTDQSPRGVASALRSSQGAVKARSNPKKHRQAIENIAKGRAMTAPSSAMATSNKVAATEMEARSRGLIFPKTADTLLLHPYLARDEAARAPLFRVYRGTPPHYQGTFWVGYAVDAG